MRGNIKACVPKISPTVFSRARNSFYVMTKNRQTYTRYLSSLMDRSDPVLLTPMCIFYATFPPIQSYNLHMAGIYTYPNTHPHSPH